MIGHVLFYFLKQTTKKTTRLALINSDWRDFQSCPALKEDASNAILLTDYNKVLEQAGWELTHIIQAPLSSERFGQVYEARGKKHIAADYYQKAADFAKIMPGFEQESVEYYLSKAKKMREEKK